MSRNSICVIAIVKMPVSLALMILIAAMALGQKVEKSKEAPAKRNLAEAARAEGPGAQARTPMDSNPLFLEPMTYRSENGVYSLAVADLNGDGKLDVIGADYFDNLLSLWLGNGDGTFQPATTFSAGSPGGAAQSVTVGDIDGDGILDIAVIFDGIPSPISILLGNGDGTFRTSQILYARYLAHAIQIADVNRDGKADLVVAEQAGGGNEVFFAKGDGTFQSNGGFGTADQNGYFVTVADVNKDGWPDLLFSSGIFGNWQGIDLNLNNGDGTFAPGVIVNVGSGESAWPVAVGDVNEDGNPDLVSATSCQTKHCDHHLGASVILGNGDGTFQAPILLNTGGDQGTVALADVNGDGHLDILYSYDSGGGDGTLAVFLGNGDGTFQPAQFFNSGLSLAVADLNGDGRPDVVTETDRQIAIGVSINNAGPHKASATELTSDAVPAAPNQPVTYTATITSQYGGAITGTVAFTGDGKALGAEVPVVNNTASVTTSYAKIGKHLIVAKYSGDYYSSTSTSPTLTEYIKSLPVVSTTHVTTSGSPSHVGEPVTFTAVVKSAFGSIPDGELVTFADGNTPLGTAPLAGGSAAFTTSGLTAKKHTINANYAGDATFKASHGTVKQDVEP